MESDIRDDEPQFIDAENYHPTQQGALTYEQLVLEQVRRCIIEGSKEMKGGYFKEKMTRMGTQEVYVDDQKQIYIQCINSLYDLLISYFDEEFNQADLIFKESLIEIRENKIKDLKDKIQYTDDIRIKRQIQMQIETGYLDPDSIEAKQAIDEKIEAYRYLYQQLILLFSRQRFLIAQAIED